MVSRETIAQLCQAEALLLQAIQLLALTTQPHNRALQQALWACHWRPPVLVGVALPGWGVVALCTQ